MHEHQRDSQGQELAEAEHLHLRAWTTVKLCRGVLQDLISIEFCCDISCQARRQAKLNADDILQHTLHNFTAVSVQYLPFLALHLRVLSCMGPAQHCQHVPLGL